MPSLLLVRHGQASFGADEYDVLSDLGRRQAAALGARLAPLGPVALLACGRLARQADTADVLADVLDVGRRVEDARLDEYGHEALLVAARGAGALEGVAARLEAAGADRSRVFQELLEVALRRWVEQGDHADEGEAETWPAFVARGSAAARDLLGRLGPSETGVAVTSGGVIAAVCARALGLDAEGWLRLNRVLANGSVTRLVRGRRGTTLVTVNDHAHLEAPGAGLLSYR